MLKKTFLREVLAVTFEKREKLVHMEERAGSACKTPLPCFVKKITGEKRVKWSKTIAKPREFFMTKRLCFNCGRPGHREKECQLWLF